MANREGGYKPQHQAVDDAINLAISHGWKPMMPISLKEQKEAASWEVRQNRIVWIVAGKHPKFSQPLLDLLFDHAFAKALWSDAIAQFSAGVSGDTINLSNIENWRGHLANMAVADDPFEYLRQNITPWRK